MIRETTPLPSPSRRRSAELAAMTNRIRIIKHEVTPDCGSYEVQIPGRPSKYFYWDEVPARPFKEDLLEREQALEKAKATARMIERRFEKALRAKARSRSA
jgi:hypothetical protein